MNMLDMYTVVCMFALREFVPLDFRLIVVIYIVSGIICGSLS